jgi:hypothetical protein
LVFVITVSKERKAKYVIMAAPRTEWDEMVGQELNAANINLMIQDRPDITDVVPVFEGTTANPPTQGQVNLVITYNIDENGDDNITDPAPHIEQA